jgi:hypothetical protein
VSRARFQPSGPVARHLTATVLLLAVFALPLHFHFFTPTAQLSQECACSHGVKSQAGLAPAPADWTPVFETSFVENYEPQVFTWLGAYSHAIRAPPYTSSL